MSTIVPIVQLFINICALTHTQEAKTHTRATKHAYADLYIVCTLERVIKVKFPLTFLEPAYLVGNAYILTENFGFGEFFSLLDG